MHHTDSCWGLVYSLSFNGVVHKNRFLFPHTKHMNVKQSNTHKLPTSEPFCSEIKWHLVVYQKQVVMLPEPPGPKILNCAAAFKYRKPLKCPTFGNSKRYILTTDQLVKFAKV